MGWDVFQEDQGLLHAERIGKGETSGQRLSELRSEGPAVETEKRWLCRYLEVEIAGGDLRWEADPGVWPGPLCLSPGGS